MIKGLHVDDEDTRELASDSTHVLIVEDDEVARTKLAGYLETAGYRVSEAIDGRGAREVLGGDPVDLVLLDINLPGEDGLELTRFIRSSRDVGIILVTGRTDDVDRIVGLEIGADDYVTKPFNPRELLARVKTLLADRDPLCVGVRGPDVFRMAVRCPFASARVSRGRQGRAHPGGVRAPERADRAPGDRPDPGAATGMHHSSVLGPGRPHGGRAGSKTAPEAGRRPEIAGAHHHRAR